MLKLKYYGSKVNNVQLQKVIKNVSKKIFTNTELSMNSLCKNLANVHD